MTNLQKIFKISITIKVILLLVLVFFYVFLYKILIHRLTAFGCMDDCNNFMGGYFLLHGKLLFTQIFFNHAPFMAHLSEFVQFTTHPQNLYELILRHRQFLLVFGFLAEAILIVRFGISGLLFALFYEITKFYLGGDRFLAEPFIVYPMVYLCGVNYKKIVEEKIFTIDFLLAPFCAWFVLFMREPYAIVSLFMLAVFLIGKTRRVLRIGSGILFLLLCVVAIFSYSIPELIFNVYTVNVQLITFESSTTGVFGLNIYKSFFYPFIVFFQGQWNFVRYLEIGLSSILLSISFFFAWKKQWLFILFLFLALGFANIRQVPPGREYYEAFHLLPWYALTIFATSLMITGLYKWSRAVSLLGCFGILCLIGYTVLSNASYIHDHIDEQTEFITNYGKVLQAGNVIGDLSTQKDTLFVDGYDDMIYFVANRYSDYQYSWFTSLMPTQSKYLQARISMFKNTPPDFYYGNCPKQTQSYYLLPDFVKKDYVRLFNLKDPSCVWVRKEKLTSISSTQWKKARESLYGLAPFSQDE